MSDRPPHSPEDLTLGGLVDEVVSQVRGALDEADVSSRGAREMLLDELKDVFQALDPGSLLRPQSAPSADGAPDVTVVDGGRAEDAPPTEGPKPDLKVAHPEPTEDASVEDVPSKPRIYTRVTVHDTAAMKTADRRPVIELDPSKEADAVRSLFRGTVSRPYRIAVETGRVRVSLDGMPAEVVRAGDSLDVEASVIQVAAVGDARAVVRYERLSG
jgi:hypothetical protein